MTRELVVADPRQAIGVVDEHQKPLGDEPQEGVALRLAEHLVHDAEAVDVDDVDGELPAGLRVRLELLGERGEEILARRRAFIGARVLRRERRPILGR